MAQIGFIGLGIMGQPMALNLLKGGIASRCIAAAAFLRPSSMRAAPPAVLARR